ncbi:MAG TPA: 4-hydroxy-tetrahydrodipicolinate reductase [Myxococcota bacterium]|nr:4-hydroxy-tetrahydrodipicolinate reductase [Myxococcota bacterium]
MPSATRVCVVGAFGRMGERVRASLASEPGMRLGAALEAPGHPRLGEPLEGGALLSDDPKAALPLCDVVIDFSTPASTLRVLDAAATRAVPCVVGTTGFSRPERDRIAEIGRHLAVVLAPNFSVAVCVLTHLAREASKGLGPGYDAEILELHHRAKRDAPSGTALRLAEAVAEGRGGATQEALVITRASETGPRPPGAIGVQALRGGDNPGEHTVFFLGEGERLELAHRAATREHFVKGALRAARWVVGRGPGLYAMEDVLGLRP